MKAGIVGLPNVGKSTLFNCLSNTKVQSANFPFCTIAPNVGIINVPDKRLERLESIVKPEKVIPATVEIVDIAGLVKGANQGEGLGNKFLENIRECNAIIHVIRCFDDDNIVHVENSVNPIRDKEIIDTELLLKDLETVSKRLDKITKASKVAANKDAIREEELLTIIKTNIEKGKSVRNIDFGKEDISIVNSLQLLTAKPILYVCNVDEKAVTKGNDYTNKVIEAIEDENAQMLILAVGIESDISEFESFEERQIFLSDLGLEESGMVRLINNAYKLLSLQTYFTAGVKEVRAWTINIGDTAPKAASVIHSDFEKGFIRAEVISYDDFISLGGEAKAKEKGKMRVEGKEYIVQDGDIIHFRFNV